MRVARDVFERMVQREAVKVIESLPEDLRSPAVEVPVITADRPTAEQIELTGGHDDLVGIYEGISLPERRVDDSGNLPDRITLFRIPLMASCGTMADLRREIRITILHELGHFFGFGEGDLEDRGL